MSITEAEVIDAIHGYIKENFLYMRPDLTLEPDEALLQKGIIDSMGVVELLQFVEDRFGAKAADDEITEENLGTMRAMARFVLAKRNG